MDIMSMLQSRTRTFVVQAIKIIQVTSVDVMSLQNYDQLA